LGLIGEAGTEAVVPLQKLNSYLNTAFEVGRHTAPVRPNPQASGGDGGTITARLRVDGDDELARLIRENAELVVEENEQDKRDRLSRL
jgi:hypothetical protein